MGEAEEQGRRKMMNFWKEVREVHIDEKEIDKLLKKLKLPEHERLARIAKYYGTTEEVVRQKIALLESEDTAAVAADHDDYEAAMLKHERRFEKKRLSDSNSSCSPDKIRKTHVEERERRVKRDKGSIDATNVNGTPLPLLKQGRLETQKSSVPKYLS